MNAGQSAEQHVDPLPVREILPDLLESLQRGGNAVIVAPPGGGKTTLVPPAVADASFVAGRQVLVLEPRRLAARSAARRMAALRGEEVGGHVGYAMRMDRRAGPDTRVLVVTEGLLSRMILEDPELAGIAAIVFDEIHERSLDGDFGLALALDVQAGLRPDLRLLAMSATLDGARVSRLLGDAPVFESTGRSFPVEIRHRERPPMVALEDHVAATIRDLLATEDGGLLVFLPGRREIERTAERLDGRVGGSVDVVALHGSLEGREQDAAIRPSAPGRRKVVLATSIAESSITIEDVRVVVDCGLSRVPRFDPGSGLTRLETVRVSRAGAEQRAGRAGRTRPGVAVRLWRAEQWGALAAFPTPEILEADLSSMVLDCAAFGVTDPTRLPFLDPPPAPALREAATLLADLGAVDADGRITPTGEAMRGLGLPVRLAHMVVAAARMGAAGDAAELAVLLTERGLGGSDVDLDLRLERFRRDRSPRAKVARQLAQRLARQASADVPQGGEPSTGALLLEAWPDRLARGRGGDGRFLLAGGSGARLDPTDPLARASWLAVADLTGASGEARIAAAAAVADAEVATVMAGRLQTVTETRFDAGTGALRRREQRRIGAIVLSERTLPAPQGAEADRATLEALREHGLGTLPWAGAAASLRARLTWLHRRRGEPWPDVGDEALTDRLEHWLLPFLAGSGGLSGLEPGRLAEALAFLLPPPLGQRLDSEAPTHFVAPTGNRLPIRYDGDEPVLAVRVQEMFGLDHHPMIAGGTVPLLLELLSPAHRPIQLTRDLPGFWVGSWADVRAEMRGRYPRHEWPADPASAAATSRAKPRAR
jgi:ATP-dependent helicase HrpB